MSVTFIILSILLVLSALGVVLFENPLHSALSLVVNLIGVACVFADLEAHFLAVIQIIVYAGAIMVLVLFVLMLLNAKSEERKFSGMTKLLSTGVIGAFFVTLVLQVNKGFWSDPAIPFVKAKNFVHEGTVELVGQELFTKYLFTFESASLLIMAAVVGATMMAKSRGRSSD